VRRSEELEAVDQKSNIDIRRATAGPHVAAISGLARSLGVSPTGVCSTAHGGCGGLPSWPCKFDSRHPLQQVRTDQCPAAPPVHPTRPGRRPSGPVHPSAPSSRQAVLPIPALDDQCRASPGCAARILTSLRAAPRLTLQGLGAAGAVDPPTGRQPPGGGEPSKEPISRVPVPVGMMSGMTSVEASGRRSACQQFRPTSVKLVP